jgi:hypothetical protein
MQFHLKFSPLIKIFKVPAFVCFYKFFYLIAAFYIGVLDFILRKFF